ncbi:MULTISPECIES: hypothetical protein [unclassified Neochlamydia]|uniref:hypothetical protein n=1 Tax=unclassified Neochlamydia TaxID=2643326 RepID=UPI00140D415B|nr:MULTISPECIES: hypothetical protein [unclassified Neochlamydia]MBS4166002.1 Uncharacterized protein [Neochlamydia sp. AcF65]MBS4170887.1 Uncharacterized protein [Neochlamydia sp. AcF95]NGY95698.1 hypothetical protein [Neochlamydia sp. AcF84]
MNSILEEIKQDFIKPAFEKKALQATARECGYDINLTFSPKEKEILINHFVKSLLKKIEDHYQKNSEFASIRVNLSGKVEKITRRKFEKKNICIVSENSRDFHDQSLEDFFPVFENVLNYLKTWRRYKY